MTIPMRALTMSKSAKGTYEILEDLHMLMAYGNTEFIRETANNAIKLIERLLKERESR